MKRLNQTESPIFMILCVLCFQRQSFLTFIFYFWSWSEPLIQIGVSVKNQNITTNSVDLDRRVIMSLSSGSILFAKRCNGLQSWKTSWDLIDFPSSKSFGRFSAIFTRQIFMTFCRSSCTPCLFWKWTFTKKEEFAPRGTPSFYFFLCPKGSKISLL